MKLEGKFKEDFEKWYKVDLFKNKNLTDAQKHEVKVFKLGHFYRQPFSMQWGVLVDFGDSVGYDLVVERHCDFDGVYHNLFEWTIRTINDSKSGFAGYEKSRHEVREQAVLKLMEIYNDKKGS